MHVRPQTPDDDGAIRTVVVAAFPTDQEARIIDALREAGHVTLSLVAEDDGQVVGSAVFSPMTVEGEAASLKVAGLGPLAVTPSHQGSGAGSALVRRGIELCREAGFEALAVYGSAVYYPRFGFVPARDLNLHCADAGIAASHFQALMLCGDRPTEALYLHYAPAFFID